MQLESFRVTNYRSINDSGTVDVARITALIGRNESGKSNLLRALHSLNPADGFKPLVKIKDFPRHRRIQECTDDTPVLDSLWSLTEDERAALSELFPRASKAKQVEVSRRYGKTRYVAFRGIPAIAYDAQSVSTEMRKLKAALEAAADNVSEANKPALDAAISAFELAMKPAKDALNWATTAAPAFGPLRKAMATAGAELSEKNEGTLDHLQNEAEAISGDEAALKAGVDWVIKQLPTFVFVDDYPDLQGNANIAQYLDRKSQNVPAAGDPYFEKLCKVAGLVPQQLHDLHNQGEAETRNQLVNRASAVVTTELRRLWSDRQLTVRFGLDAAYLTTFVSDPNAAFAVEVNLDERSRGFRWFFSFYITFAADTDGGSASNAILLLDEPGLYLHARSQEDFLDHMEEDFDNQILYTTHSPFMVPTKALDTIRTVNIKDQEGTTVTNDPSGDSRTLFPLQTALGYDLAQSLFVGSDNLVVEGVTDYWFISSVNEHLKDAGKVALNEAITITPAGGAQKVPYMVALLSAQRLRVLVLLDSESAADDTRDDIIKSKLAKEKAIIPVALAFDGTAPAEADIEDLLDPSIYEQLVKESYAKELKGKKLALNEKIPRAARRVAKAFEDLGLAFHKTRPAKLFLSKMGKDPSTVADQATLERFERLFAVINERHSKLPANGKPFE